MTTMTINSPPQTGDREIILSREINAPREKVFDAWSRPELLAQWWGPNGFTTTTKQFNFKPGGDWRFIMHGPDGTDYLNHIIYDEIERTNRLVYHHSGEEGTEHIKFVATITFEELDGKTKVTLHSRFESAEILREVVEKYGAIEGGKQTLARLDKFVLASLAI